MTNGAGSTGRWYDAWKLTCENCCRSSLFPGTLRKLRTTNVIEAVSWKCGDEPASSARKLVVEDNVKK
jgi:hypothetical protein